MITIFMEYRIDPDKRNEYMALMSEIAQEVADRGGDEYRFYEGMDQPNLFVETFVMPSWDDYISCKDWRTSDKRLAHCVIGGSPKIHVWAFQQVSAQ